MHIIAAKAVAFGEALQDEFKQYATNVVNNAKVLAESLTANGINLVSGGTDNHLMLIDTRNLGITGKDAEHVLDEVGITVNKNAIPFDPTSPFITSGIRVGTPAATARGMNAEAMTVIAEVIAAVLKNPQDEAVKEEARGKVRDLTAKFPIYPGLTY